jgi:hypothetical protein
MELWWLRYWPTGLALTPTPCRKEIDGLEPSLIGGSKVSSSHRIGTVPVLVAGDSGHRRPSPASRVGDDRSFPYPISETHVLVCRKLVGETITLSVIGQAEGGQTEETNSQLQL